jgi:hypothetical protein
MVDLFLLEMICIFIYYLITKDGIKDKVLAFFVNALFIGFFILGIIVTKKYYFDIPYALSGKYLEVSGECTRMFVDHGKASHIDLYIKNTEFHLKRGYEDSIKKGSLYRVVYLPNSHEVVGIYTSKVRPRLDSGHVAGAGDDSQNKAVGTRARQ